MYYLGTDCNQYIVFLDLKLYNIWIHSIIHTKSIFQRISSAQLGILNVPKSDHILIHLQLIEKSSQAVKQSHVKTMSQIFGLIKGMLKKVLWLAKPWVNSKHSSGNNDIIYTPLDFIYFLCEFNIYWCRYMSPFCTLQTHRRLSFVWSSCLFMFWRMSRDTKKKGRMKILSPEIKKKAPVTPIWCAF